jgi:hypothetical protein
MTDQWYYAQQGQRHGPVSEEHLKELTSSGQVKPADLVWKKGMVSWRPAAKVVGFFDELPPLPSGPKHKHEASLEELLAGAADIPTLELNKEPDWPTDARGRPWPVAWYSQGAGNPLVQKPCPPKDYSVQWERIKGFLIDHGLSYMIDTDEKIEAQAKNFDFLLGWGEGYLATDLLIMFLRFVGRR